MTINSDALLLLHTDRAEGTLLLRADIIDDATRRRIVDRETGEIKFLTIINTREGRRHWVKESPEEIYSKVKEAEEIERAKRIAETKGLTLSTEQYRMITGPRLQTEQTPKES